MSARVLSVGQCAFDHGNISRTLKGAFGCEVVGVSSAQDAIRLLGGEKFDLVLVNRVFDADGGSGLELIRRLKAEPASADVPVMLVSNYDDAQAQAVAAGAVPGFGKAALGSAETVAVLKPYLAG